MASTYETSINGKIRWVSQEVISSENGKNRYIRGTGRTKEEAIARRVANANKRKAGIPTRRNPEEVKRAKREGHTVASAFEKFIESRRVEDGRAETTIAKYRSEYRNHIDPYLGGHRLADLTSDMLREHFYGTLPRSGVGSSAIVHCWKSFNGLLNFSVKRKFIRENPLSDVTRPTHKTIIQREDKRYAGKRANMAGNLLRWLEDPSNEYHFYYPLVFGLFLGLRRGELLALRWSDVYNLSRKGRAYFNVGHTLTRHTVEEAAMNPENTGFYIRNGTKNGKDRDVAIPEPLRKALLELRKRNIQARNSRFEDCIFLSPTGGLIAPAKLATLWTSIQTAYATKNGRKIQPGDLWRLHANRHVAASVLTEVGIPLPVIQAILGHSEDTQTIYYTHINSRQNQQAMSRLAKHYER